MTDGIAPQPAEAQMQLKTRPASSLRRRWTIAAVIGIPIDNYHIRTEFCKAQRRCLADTRRSTGNKSGSSCKIIQIRCTHKTPIMRSLKFELAQNSANTNQKL